MKRSSLLVAAVLILAANALSLVHAWRNRSVPVESNVTLTERELQLSYSANEDDSGVTLRLHWIHPEWALSTDGNRSPWLDQNALLEIGFPASVPPSNREAAEFYARQRPRPAFVALEYDGPSWRKWIDEFERQTHERLPAPAEKTTAGQRQSSTRLVAIDASRDAVQLRARHPDRGSVIIVPAVISIRVEPQTAKSPPRLLGAIQEIPASIYVPLPFSKGFQRLKEDRGTLRYRVSLRYGASLEPWIAGVEFLTPNTR